MYLSASWMNRQWLTKSYVPFSWQVAKIEEEGEGEDKYAREGDSIFAGSPTKCLKWPGMDAAKPHLLIGTRPRSFPWGATVIASQGMFNRKLCGTDWRSSNVLCKDSHDGQASSPFFRTMIFFLKSKRWNRSSESHLKAFLKLYQSLFKSALTLNL